MVVVCSSCGTTVLPLKDQTCPSCKGSTIGSAAAPPVVQREPTADDRAWDAYHREQAEEAALTSATRARGNLMILVGLALGGIGVVASVLSFGAASGGGRFVVFTGMILGGGVLVVRGIAQRGASRR